MNKNCMKSCPFCGFHLVQDVLEKEWFDSKVAFLIGRRL